MRLIIDLNEHQAVSDFATLIPPQPFEFKDQDTIDFQIYFVIDGVVQDLGPGFALKFGMIVTGDATGTLLAYQTVSSYLTDVNGNIYYQMQVVMNTSQMATAMGSLAQINCTIEIRYQQAGEIIHTLNIAAIVFDTVLDETGVTPPGVSTGYPDASTLELLVHKGVASGYAGLNASAKLLSTQIPVDGQTVIIDSNNNIALGAILAYTAASFITPAVNATVSVTFVSTSNLHAGQYVRIPIAGYYSVTSIADSTHAVLTNIGDPLNAVSGTTITSGAALLPAQAVSGGGGGTPGQAAFTTTTASFTVPAVAATVTIAVGNTSWMGGNGYYIYITGAGYFVINSITDTTHAVVANAGSPSNAIAGTVVVSGAAVSAAGTGGAQGTAGSAGLSAYDALTASFTMPNAAVSVNISINNTGWIGLNQVIYIASAGYFQVTSILSATQLTAVNLNYPGNAAATTSIASGSKVSPGGLIGAQGAGGAGLNAFTTLSANYVQPAINATVTVNVGTTAWMANDLGIFIQGGGYYTVQSILDLTHAVITNLGGASNIAVGSIVTGNGTQNVTPAGVQGLPGVSSYTTTTANFTMPAAGASITISLQTTAFIQQNQNIFVAGAGYFTIASIIDSTRIAATNLAASGNVSSGTIIPSGAGVTTAGAIGPTGSPGPTGRDGAYSTIYTSGSIQGNGGVASPASLIGDVASGSSPNTIYQRGASGVPVWAAIPVDGTTITIVSGQLVAHTPQENLGAHLETPIAKTYTIDLAASSPYTIKAFKCILGAGTLTLALVQNGSNVSGAGAISVSTTLSTTTLSQAVALNDKIQITLSSLASSPTDLQFTMWIQR